MHEHDAGTVGPERESEDGTQPVESTGHDGAAADDSESPSSRFHLSWKTRTKLVVVLSFVVLIGVQIVARNPKPIDPKLQSDKKASDQGNPAPKLAINSVSGNESRARGGSSVEQTALVTGTSAAVEPVPPNASSSLDGGLLDVTRPSDLPPAPPRLAAGDHAPPAEELGVESVPPANTNHGLNEPEEQTSSRQSNVVAGANEDRESEKAPLIAPRSEPFIPPQEPPASMAHPAGEEQHGASAAATAPKRPDVPGPGITQGASTVPVEPRAVAPDSITFSATPESTPRTGAGNGHTPASPATHSVAPPRNAAGGQIEPITHIVRRGENFWTIARHYYGSGRFYRALWKANEHRVPRIDELYIGTPIQVPAPEDLDRTYIDPPSRGASSPRTGSIVPPRDPEVARTSARQSPGFEASSEGTASRPASQGPHTREYVTRTGETLRSIAARELGDAHRDTELERLNVDAVQDPLNIPAGTLIRIPRSPSREN